jgi:hypothetical protein
MVIVSSVLSDRVLIPAIISSIACGAARRGAGWLFRLGSIRMKIKLTLLGILAAASMAVTLLALSSETISQAAPDDETGQSEIESSYDG